MLKKLSLILATIFLMACSNTKIVEENTKKSEIIRQAISTPEKNIILLGDNYDYLFTGEEAGKILTLIDFIKIEGLSGNIKNIKKSLTIEESGLVELWISTEFEIYKKDKSNINNKEFEKEQENFIYNFRKKLDEKNIKYKIKENNKSWKIYLPNAINVSGQVARLENRDKILQETSNQLVNLKIDLIVRYRKEVEKKPFTESVKETGATALTGVVIYYTAPVWIAFTVIYTALFIPAVLIGGR